MGDFEIRIRLEKFGNEWGTQEDCDSNLITKIQQQIQLY